MTFKVSTGLSTSGLETKVIIQDPDAAHMVWSGPQLVEGPPRDPAAFAREMVRDFHWVLLRHCGATLTGRIPVDFDKLRIPVRNEGTLTHLRFVDCTKDQIALATRALKRGVRPPKTSPVVKLIAKSLGKKPLSAVKVSVTGGKLTLSGIALAWLHELGKALQKLRLERIDD